MIAGIILAAGQSQRFGSNKRLHKINGRPLIDYSLRACVESSLPSLYVVVDTEQPDTSELVMTLFPRNGKVRVIENTTASRGHMSSVKAGLRALPAEVTGAMVVLADMPLITAVMIDKLCDTFAEHDTVVVPECDGRHYHPKILPRALFPQFLALGDDARGTSVLATLGDGITTVAFAERHLFLDIDDIDDLNELERLLASSE